MKGFVRGGDIEELGSSSRHSTLVRMNFSFFFGLPLTKRGNCFSHRRKPNSTQRVEGMAPIIFSSFVPWSRPLYI